MARKKGATKTKPNGRKSASEAKQTDKKDVKVKGKWVNQVGLVIY